MSTPTSSSRQEQIVDAATSLVRERGFAALSVRAVAARAGIGASTMRYYFPSQEALVDVVAAALVEVRVTDLRLADESVPRAERLVECLSQFLPADPSELPSLAAWLSAQAAAFGTQAAPEGLEAAVMRAGARTSREAVTRWLEVLGVPSERRGAGVTELLVLLDGLAVGLADPDGALTLEDARALLSAAAVRLVG